MRFGEYLYSRWTELPLCMCGGMCLISHPVFSSKQSNVSAPDFGSIPFLPRVRHSGTSTLAPTRCPGRPLYISVFRTRCLSTPLWLTDWHWQVTAPFTHTLSLLCVFGYAWAPREGQVCVCVCVSAPLLSWSLCPSPLICRPVRQQSSIPCRKTKQRTQTKHILINRRAKVVVTNEIHSQVLLLSFVVTVNQSRIEGFYFIIIH